MGGCMTKRFDTTSVVNDSALNQLEEVAVVKRVKEHLERYNSRMFTHTGVIAGKHYIVSVKRLGFNVEIEISDRVLNNE